MMELYHKYIKYLVFVEYEIILDLSKLKTKDLNKGIIARL